MKYCSTCGKELYDNAVICPYCGVQIKAVDRPSKCFAALGFFFPVVGLILYIVNHTNYPKKAASAIKGTLWGIIVPLAIVFVLIIISAVFFLIFRVKFSM